MGLTEPHAGGGAMGLRGLVRQGSAERARRISYLLAGTALVSAASLALAATDANAACTVAAATVTCGSTTTQNTTFPVNAATGTDRNYQSGAAVTANGVILDGATVGGFGFAIGAAPGQQVTVQNDGAVNLTAGAAFAGGDGALRINGSGAAAVYQGDGSVTATVAFTDALVITNTGTGSVSVVNAGPINSVTGTGARIRTATGATEILGSAAISGAFGVDVLASGAGAINIAGSGPITGGISGVTASSNGGNVQVATTSTITGVNSFAIRAATSGTGTVIVTTGGAVSGSSSGIVTSAANGGTTINIGHDVTGTSLDGIRATGSGSGTIDINHTAGIIAGGLAGIFASQSGSGAIDISHAGGALNGTTGAVSASTTGSGNVIVSLTGGTVGNVSGVVINTSATTGTTTITNNLALTSTGGHGAAATSTSGIITVQGSGSITGQSDGVNATSTAAGGNITVTGLALVQGITGNGIIATVDGADISVTGNTTVTGNLRGIDAVTGFSGGDISIQDNGSITGNLGNAVNAVSHGGQLSIQNNGPITSNSAVGINADSGAAVLSIIGNNAISGLGTGVIALGGDLSIQGNDSIAGTNGDGLNVAGRSVAIGTVTTNGAISGGTNGIVAGSGVGGITFVSGGTVSGATGIGISTTSGNGDTMLTLNHAVSGGTQGVNANSDNGAITVQGTGTITGGSGTAINATSTGGDIRVLGLSAIGAVTATSTNGTVGVTATSSTNSYALAGSITALLPGGTINALSTSGVDVTNATGFVTLVNNTTITNAGNAVTGSAATAFTFANFGTVNGNVNVTGSNPLASGFFNFGTWNTGTGNSTFSGRLNNSGTVNMQNGVAGQVIAVGGSYDGGGAYRIDVGGSADRINVVGAADLTGGAVNAAFLPGATPGSHTILRADGGLGGTEFASLTTGAFTNFVTSLSYTPTDVLLNLTASLGLGANLNQNQQNVANTLNTFFNAGNALPPGFVTLFGLTGQPLANALTQLSGEHATGIQRATNLSTGMFLNAMLDPFVMGRVGGFGAGGAMGYAPEPREAYAADMPLKVAPPAAIYEQRWSVWGAGYGGRSRVDGEPGIGSNDLTANAAGFAVGADYRVSPSSVIGAAFAIGETRWNVAGVGKGNADVAQVGGYASTRWNDLYVSGAVALAWHDASTDRTLNIAGTDQLRADFNATSWGARFEGGYRYGGPVFGLTPYAAVQMQSVRTPDYSERATSGSNQFALSYVSESVIDTRTELGFWADTRHALSNGALVILRGRAAWVHDFNPDSRIQAAFQTLPGTSFVVDGAAAPRDAALTSAVAELRMTNGVSLIGKFDGEFSGRSTTYAGTGTLKYAW